MRGRKWAWVAVLFMALVGAGAGIAVVGSGLIPPEWHLYPSWTKTYALPHRVPKFPGGISLRFAMVHDVLHERFARHGQSYYAERNRSARQELQGLAQRPLKGQVARRYFPLMDDLGAGLDQLGEHQE